MNTIKLYTATLLSTAAVVTVPYAVFAQSPLETITETIQSGSTYIQDISNVRTQLLGAAQGFHIFAREAAIGSTHTNGNIATELLIGTANFGTSVKGSNEVGGTSNQQFASRLKDISYIQNFEAMTAKPFTTKRPNKIIFGESVSFFKQFNERDENGKQIVGGTSDPSFYVQNEDGTIVKFDDIRKTGQLQNNEMNRFYYAETLFQDKNGEKYIDFDQEFNNLTTLSNQLATVEQSEGIVTDYQDRNRRSIDVSNAVAKDGYVYVTISRDVLELDTQLTIKGLSLGTMVIINVDAAGSEVINTRSKIVLNYNGVERNNRESEYFDDNVVLWNFVNGSQSFSGTANLMNTWQGSILAPNAEVSNYHNVDGNIIAKKFKNKGGETHRWDFQGTVVEGTEATPEEPETNPGAEVTPEEPETNPGAEVTPEEPETNPGTEVTPEEPEINPGTEVTPEEPETNPGTEITPEEPETNPGTEVTPEEPETNPGTEVTPEEPETNPGAEVTPEEPEINPGTEVTPEEPEIKPGTEVTPEPEVNPGTEVTPEEPETNPGTEITPEEPETNPGTEVTPEEPETNPGTEVTPEEPEINPGTEVTPEPETDPGTEVMPEPEINPGTEVTPEEPEINPGTEVKPEPEVNPGTEGTPEEPETNPGTEVTPEPETDPGTEVIPEPETNPGTEITPEPEVTPGKEGTLEPETNPGTEVTPEPEEVLGTNDIEIPDEEIEVSVEIGNELMSVPNVFAESGMATNKEIVEEVPATQTITTESETTIEKLPQTDGASQKGIMYTGLALLLGSVLAFVKRRHKQF
ncbi:hypothetical protein DCE79_01670 [Lysinibacillus sp. 2017]|uniref:collagen-binding domain-containing protein n=1 Tax=unclassified Lysinibacillus TaxID=2636778 RepID=UPI000D52A0EB|nr:MULTISPECIES: collagen-binding domain-containing protein [unclassified Lysinibacillus]AWE06169.1 hypothetical protein DCE79_01670 [Lysinibacillus sp. 2017]TGN35176.1 choice-of-anchor A family protein [Lysinibacillus sp. S2017]